MAPIRAWLQQPTTVAGISTIMGTVVALLLGQITFAQAIPLFAAAAISAILPDNTAAKQETEMLAASLMQRYGPKH